MINKLIQCDCMDYLRTCKDKQFDLAIVDPPYGLDERLSNCGANAKLKHTPMSELYRNSKKWDKIPDKKYFEELFRVSKNQIIWGGNYFSLPASRCMICWDKKQKMPSLSSWELGWTSFDKPSKIFSCVSTDLDRIHPTQKPVSLYKWLLKNYAHTGDKLFDTHSGSGSFRIAAYDMGFDLISCEIDADYCHDNEARYQSHIAQQELIPVQEIQQLTLGEGEMNGKNSIIQ